MSVLLLSGGLDSAVLLAREVNSENCPLCLGFDYGQRHRRELVSAARIADRYGCRYEQIQLPRGLLSGGCLTADVPVPYAHHEDPVQVATVVPNRNMVLLSLAAAVAVRRGDGEILFAGHAGDAAVYHDCRPAFVAALSRAMELACGAWIEAPFLAMTKRDVVGLGRTLGVPFEMTWSCYSGGDEPCHECGACRERDGAMA